MFSSLSFFRQSAATASRSSSTNAQAAPAQPVAQPGQGKGRDSVRVELSDQARERLEAARKVASAMQGYQRELKEAQKDQARERVEMVKRRIEELKHLLMMFGAAGAKGLVRELKQLAGELSQAASVLKDGSGGGGAMAGVSGAGEGTADAAAQGTQAEAAAGDAEARAAYATTQAMAMAEADATAQEDGAQQSGATDEESSGEAGKPLGSSQDAAAMERQQQAQQRRDDAKSLAEAVRSLKALLAMLKSTLRSEDNDKDTQKQLKDIEKLIDDSEQAAQALGTGGGLTVDLAVSVEAGI